MTEESIEKIINLLVMSIQAYIEIRNILVEDGCDPNVIEAHEEFIQKTLTAIRTLENSLKK